MREHTAVNLRDLSVKRQWNKIKEIIYLVIYRSNAN